MAELLPCPFCKSAGEIYKGRAYAPNCKTFQTEAETEDWIAEMQKKYIVKGTNVMRVYRKQEIKYRVLITRQAYIPRCTRPGCLARSVVLFPTEKAAEAAWNRRETDG